MNGNINTKLVSESISPSTPIVDKNTQPNYTKYNPMEFIESDKAVVSDALANNNKQLLLANLYHYFIECKNYRTAISLLKESDVPISISTDLLNEPEMLLISQEEKNVNKNIDTFIIEHNNLEIELFENQYIKSKSSMPRDGSFMVQWWDCLWSIYNNVNSQPLELLSSVRPFIDVIKPIFPEHIPVNNAGSPIHPPNLDITSMNISRPDMYTNANLLRNDYQQNKANDFQQNGSSYSSPYLKGNENLNQNINEDIDPKNFTPSNQNIHLSSSVNKNFNKMNQKPALHQVLPNQIRRGSVTSQYSSPHNVNNNMHFNSQKIPPYVSGIPTAKNNNEMKKNIMHQDPKFYPQDGIFRPPSSQKPNLLSSAAPLNEVPNPLYTNSYGNIQRMSQQEEFAKQNSASNQQKNIQNNLQFQPGLINSNPAFNEIHMNNYPIPSDAVGNGNVQMMQQYQQGIKNSRGPSQSYGNSANTPSSNIVNSNFGTPANKNPQPPNYPQGSNTQYFIPGNQNAPMDKMQMVPLSNINEEQEKEYKKALQASEWNFNNNIMRNPNTNVETTQKAQDFMDLRNVNFSNGMNFHYPPYMNKKAAEMNQQPRPIVPNSQVNLDMYNNLRVSTEVDTTITKKKPSGKPKGRPKKTENLKENPIKKQTKQKKSSLPSSTKTSSILGKEVYLEDLGDTGIVFQKERKLLKETSSENKHIHSQFQHSFNESGHIQANQVSEEAGNTGTSIEFFGNDNFKDIYSMVSTSGNILKTEKNGKHDMVNTLIHDDFGMHFPPLQSDSNKLIAEDTNHQDLLDSFLMEEISGVSNKNEKESKKNTTNFGNGLNFNLNNQGR